MPRDSTLANDLECETQSDLRGFRARVQYDGRRYHGWQFQPDVPTVEGELRRAIARLTSGPFDTVGASRTDRGVHAFGQVVRLDLATELTAERIERALDALTPPDIRVDRVAKVDRAFHPQFDAREKHYIYRLCHGRRGPLFARPYLWWLPHPVDSAKMQRAAQQLVGRHDFAAFRNRSKDAPEDTVRTVTAIACSVHAQRIDVEVIGDGFLYRMVRNIVGSLVEVGRGAWSETRLAEALASADRRRAGPTAPADGLFLAQIAFPGEPPLRLHVRPIAIEHLEFGVFS